MSRLHRPSSTKLHPLSALSLEGSFLPSTGSLLQNFSQLTMFTFELTVTATNILKEILKISSSLLSLLQFKLELPEDEYEELRTNLSKDSALYIFPSLETLNVVGPARHVRDILRSIYGVCLSRITFTILPYADTTRNEIPKCIRRCTTMTPTLLHLRINLPPHSIQMDNNMFAPFRTYRLLRSLHVNSLVLIQPYIEDLFDEEFGEWPILETAIFELNDGHGEWPDEIHPTAPIQLPATSCPKLRKLEIYLPNPFTVTDDVVASDTLQNLLDSSERTDHILEELKITLVEPPAREHPSTASFMEGKEAILLARVIDHLYPNLKRLDICGDIEMLRMGDARWRPWYRGVEMMVTNFREARSGGNVAPCG
jgi:hypothetical protein